MNEAKEKELRASLQPLSEIVRTTFVEAMLLRIKVHVVVASNNGAELEDVQEIVAQAIASGSNMTSQFLDDLSEVEKSRVIEKRENTKP